MWLKIIKIFILILVVLSCKEVNYKQKNQFGQIKIDNNFDSSKEIKKIIAPYKKIVDDSLNQILCYSKKSYSKFEGHFNTAIGNMMADATFELVAPIFKEKYNIDIDIVLLNYGGIRSSLPMGKITTENAYEIMPFENKIIAVKMKYDIFNKLIRYLIIDQKAHPISGMKIEISKNNELNNLLVQNQQIDKEKNYYVATSDYLYKGGDNMSFFSESDSVYTTNYKIRDILIDFFKKSDTVNLSSDNRFIYSNLK